MKEKNDVIYFAAIYTFPKLSPSVVEKNFERDADEKRLLFYCFISLTKTMSVSIYNQLNAKMDFKQISYFTDIIWQKMAKRGADVSVRDEMFALYLLKFTPMQCKFHNFERDVTTF